MCGFVGFVDKRKDKNEVIKKMTDVIAHRGPDSDGYYYDDEVALGFRRLSIIDLSSNGSQPLYNEDKTMAIIFNGEIYNYQEIKEDLLEKGHIFSSGADTEVLIHGYEEYKEDLLKKLRGMFAFVIYDIKNKELFAVRDFYGIKPFYYYKKEDLFIFGSEIKSFLSHPDFDKELNDEVLERYLSFQYSPLEETFFKNVYKLAPGHYLKYKDNELTINKYYELQFEENNEVSKEEWLKGLKEQLDDTIRAHKISDVEVGSFLSSGIDSSFITVKSAVDKTFTVGFADKKYNEIDYAKDLSSKINVTNISKVITKEEFFEVFPTVQYHMDEPLADASAVALYFVTREARKNLKVVLSGEGSDEIFAGYNIYQEPYSLPFYYKVPFPVRKAIGKIASLFGERRGLNVLVRRSERLENRYIGNAFIFKPKEVKNILSYKPFNKGFKELTLPYYTKVKDKDMVTKMQYIDFNFWLVGDILLKADKMSMANSIEVRVPYLDRMLIDYARHIPVEYKIDSKTTKKIFREVANEVLEDKVASKKKLGFPVPIRVWLKEDDIYNEVKELFQNSSKFFNTNKIIKLLDEHKNNKKDNSRKIWTIYSFLVWYKKYFEEM